MPIVHRDTDWSGGSAGTIVGHTSVSRSGMTVDSHLEHSKRIDTTEADGCRRTMRRSGRE